MGYTGFVPSAKEPEVIYRMFGRRLREVRERKQVSQEELAALSSLTRSSIANIENGRQRVLLHQVVAFADALKVEFAEIVPKLSDMKADAELYEQYVNQLHDTLVQRLAELQIGPPGANQNAEKDS